MRRKGSRLVNVRGMFQEPCPCWEEGLEEMALQVKDLEQLGCRCCAVGKGWDLRVQQADRR